MERKNISTVKLFNPGLFRSSADRIYLIGLHDGKPIEPITLVDTAKLLGAFEMDSIAFKTANAIQNDIIEAMTHYMSAGYKNVAKITLPDFNFFEAVKAMATELEYATELKNEIQNCICHDEKIINEYVEALKSSSNQS